MYAGYLKNIKLDNAISILVKSSKRPCKLIYFKYLIATEDK